MKSRSEMKEYLGVSGIGDLKEGPPECPECGATMEEVKAEKGDHGFVRIPAHLECPECEYTEE